MLVNGAFKLVINVRKGILGEKLLKMLRFDLFALMMRFKPEDVRTLKPAEAASMIKDEVEPIGDFAGDAFIQPAFLGVQAMTAMTFILLQNVLLGLVALSIVLVQAILIPRLRRRQLILGRQRQLEQRMLAGRIGSVVEAAPTIHSNGAVEYQKSLVERQLTKLLDIRVALFKRKFAVKYLNNLLAQITPFFFYAIGGYFALRGQLDVGQLVAVIFAYRDLPPPIKELIDWDQQRNDIAIKYEQVIGQFANKGLLPDDEGLAAMPEAADLQTIDLRVVDRHGSVQLDTTSVLIPQGSHTALVGAATSGRDILARTIARQITDFQGDVQVGGRSLRTMSSESLSRMVMYATSDPGLISGSIRENVLIAVRRSRAVGDTNEDWTDLEATGATSVAEVDEQIIDALNLVGMGNDLYRFGLHGRVEEAIDETTASRLLEARRLIRADLDRQGLLEKIEPFDPNRYNGKATLGENLMFGVALTPTWSDGEIGRNALFFRFLQTERLTSLMGELGAKIAGTMLEMVADLPQGHPLFERYSLIAHQELAEVRLHLAAMASSNATSAQRKAAEAKFIGLALRYSEDRHRFALLDDELRARIVAARQKLRTMIEKHDKAGVEFYDPDKLTLAAPVRENILFGRMGFGLPQTEQQILATIREVLDRLGLEPAICRLGLNYEVGPGGKMLSPTQRCAVNVARCLVKKTPIVIFDGALAAYSPDEEEALLQRLREKLAGRTLIMTRAEGASVGNFDTIVAFKGPKAQLASKLAEAG